MLLTLLALPAIAVAIWSLYYQRRLGDEGVEMYSLYQYRRREVEDDGRSETT